MVLIEIDDSDNLLFVLLVLAVLIVLFGKIRREFSGNWMEEVLLIGLLVCLLVRLLWGKVLLVLCWHRCYGDFVLVFIEEKFYFFFIYFLYIFYYFFIIFYYFKFNVIIYYYYFLYIPHYFIYILYFYIFFILFFDI